MIRQCLPSSAPTQLGKFHTFQNPSLDVFNISSVGIGMWSSTRFFQIVLQLSMTIFLTVEVFLRNENTNILKDVEDEVGDQVQGPGTETETEQPTKLTSCQLTRKRKETVQETVAKKMLVLEEKKLELLGSQPMKIQRTTISL